MPIRHESARLGQLQRLQHRLVVLRLVLDDHLPDERIGIDSIEHRERPVADLVQIGERLLRTEVGQVAAVGAGRLGRVVDLPEALARGPQPADVLAEPEVLERGDVAQVPDQRAHQRVVDPVQVLL